MSWTVRLVSGDDVEALDHLRALPMAGAVRLSLLVPSRPGDRIVVAERDGEAMAMGVRSRRVHIWDGIRRPVGVLTGMRSICPVIPRRTMARMYDVLQSDRGADEPDWDLTSILEGNRPARRLLEAGLPGLPRYTEVARLSTLTFVGGGGPVAGEGTLRELVVSVPGASARIERPIGRITRVAGYSGVLARVRPVADRILRVLGRPGLPPAGRAISEAFATSVEWEGRRSLAGLVDGIRQETRRVGAGLVHWGVPADHPDLRWLKARLRAWETRSVIYSVHDPRIPFAVPADIRPEVVDL